jgi:hypothetical protein
MGAGLERWAMSEDLRSIMNAVTVSMPRAVELEALDSYRSVKRGARNMPRRKDIDPGEIRSLPTYVMMHNMRSPTGTAYESFGAVGRATWATRHVR